MCVFPRLCDIHMHTLIHIRERAYPHQMWGVIVLAHIIQASSPRALRPIVGKPILMQLHERTRCTKRVNALATRK